MPSLLGTTVTANYNRMVGPNYTASGDVRTYTGPYSTFGTRALKFYSVVAVHAAAPVDFSKATLAGAGLYTDSNSVFAKAVLALQQFGEIHFIGTPGTAGFIVAVATETANTSDTGNGVVPIGTECTIMETAVKAAIAADTSATVTEVTVQATGISIS